MAQPTAYTRLYSFTQWSTDYPTTPHAGLRIDAELNAVKHTLDDVLRNLAVIQRDDTQLGNNTVGAQQLKPELLLATSLPTDWLTGTAYERLDIVYQSNALYLCNTDHTAGVFATDLAAAKWTAILDYTDPLGRAEAAATAAEAYESAASAYATTATTQAGIATTQAAAAAASAVLAASYLSSITFPIPIAQGGHGGSTAAQARTNLGLAIGTDVLAYDAALQSIAALGTAADKGVYFTGVNTAAEFDLKSVGRTLLAQTTQAAMRGTGLGSTTVGDAVFIATNAVAAQTAIGVIDSTLAHLAGPETFTGAKTFSARIKQTGGELRNADNAAFYSWYNGADSTRSGYAQLTSAGSGSIVNEISGGTWNIATAGGGNITLNGNTAYHAGNLPGTALTWTAAQTYSQALRVFAGDTSIRAESTTSWLGLSGGSGGFGSAGTGTLIIRGPANGGSLEHYIAAARVAYFDATQAQVRGTNTVYAADNLPGTSITWTAAQGFSNLVLFNNGQYAYFQNTGASTRGFLGASGTGLDAAAASTDFILRYESLLRFSAAGATALTLTNALAAFTVPIQARARALTTTSGTLVVADANCVGVCTGGITLPNSIFTALDTQLFDAGTAARTFTRGAGIQMLLNGTDVATATLASNQLGTVFWRTASIAVLGGAFS